MVPCVASRSVGFDTVHGYMRWRGILAPSFPSSSSFETLLDWAFECRVLCLPNGLTTERRFIQLDVRLAPPSVCFQFPIVLYYHTNQFAAYFVPHVPEDAAINQIPNLRWMVDSSLLVPGQCGVISIQDVATRHSSNIDIGKYQGKTIGGGRTVPAEDACSPDDAELRTSCRSQPSIDIKRFAQGNLGVFKRQVTDEQP